MPRPNKTLSTVDQLELILGDDGPVTEFQGLVDSTTVSNLEANSVTPTELDETGDYTTNSISTGRVISKSRPGQAVVFLTDAGDAVAVGEGGVLASGSDHSAVIQTALDNRGVVILKQGVYSANLTIPRNTVLRGAGRHQSDNSTQVATLTPDTSSPVFEFSAADPDGQTIGLNTTIKNLNIDGQGGSSDLFSVTAGYNLFVRDCILKSTSGHAFDLNKTWDSWIERCKFNDTGDASTPNILLRNATASSNPTNGIRIINCGGSPAGTFVAGRDKPRYNWIHNCRMEQYENTDRIVDLAYDFGESGRGAGEHNWITNNYFYGGTTTTVRTTSFTHISNNTIISGTADTLDLVDGYNKVNNNFFKANGGDAISGEVIETQICGNHIQEGDNGINLTLDEYGRNFLISNNIFDRVGKECIIISGSQNVRGANITGNNFGYVNRDAGSSNAVIRVSGIDGISVVANNIGNAGGGIGILVGGDADTFVCANKVNTGGIDTSGSANATVTANDS